MKLIEKLKQKQQEEHLTDKQMAGKLGMHHITWVNKKNGKYPLSSADKERAIRIYADLIPLFLSENANLVSEVANK